MFTYVTHILLDGARLRDKLEEAKTRNHQHDSLYRGGIEAHLSAVGPYIFRFAYHTPFADWFFKTGWGKSWGVMLKSSWPISELHNHFRKFLIVKDDEDRQLYLRFYDPRVIRTFLPNCDAGQLREFFGQAIDYFIVEDEDPGYALRFWHENGMLKSERFPVADIIASLPETEPLPLSTQEELPPETVATLKEQGILEQVLAIRNGAAKEQAPMRPEQKNPPEPEPAPDMNPMLDAHHIEATTKTKWHMFE